MKNILIDGYNLGLDKGTGVATYARNLSYELHNLGHEVAVLYGNRDGSSRDRLLREIAFFDRKNGERKLPRTLKIAEQAYRAVLGPLGHSAVDVPVTGQVVARSFNAGLPYFDAVYNAADVFKRSQSAFKLWGRACDVDIPNRPDLVHWTYPMPLRLKGVPNIYTLHDLVPLRLPYTTLDNKRHYLKLLQHLKECADHFVTVSESSKRDLVEILDIAPERITNTYQSVEIPVEVLAKSDEEIASEVEGIVGVDYKQYLLFWGSIEPKKNVGRMIEAYLMSKVDTPLVIVGAQAWKSKQELRLLKDGNRFPSHKRILQLSYLPLTLLFSLIRGAKAALFPSLYEGFGLPALEAMLLGTPVICSNTSSLPEVVGDAAISVDPYDTTALAAAIRRIDNEAGLRAELSRRGRGQARRFTPQAYRERLQSVYQGFL